MVGPVPLASCRSILKGDVKTLAAMAVGACLLNACATRGCNVRHIGAMPLAPPGATFSLVAGDGTPPPLAAALARRVTRAGLISVGDHPAFYVESLYSERGGRVGAYSQVGAKNAPLWLESPARGPWWRRHARWVQQLTVRIIDGRTGRELYRADAEEMVGPERPVDWERLAGDALSGAPFPDDERRGARCAPYPTRSRGSPTATSP